MKLHVHLLFPLLCFASFVVGCVEDILDPVRQHRVKRYPTGNILFNMALPRQQVEEQQGRDVAPHLQYTVYLDQAGAFDSTTGLTLTDPEAAVVLANGLFPYPDRPNVQRFNRCYDEHWSMFWSDVTTMNRRTLSKTGKGFYRRIADGKLEDCILTFHWNNDFTRATITGYFEELFGLPSDVNNFLEVSIELNAFWKWKFGLTPDTTGFANLDSNCCQGCEGWNVLGKGDACDTISTACTGVNTDCAMWTRRNTIFPGWPFETPVPANENYSVYAIGDKNGFITSYFPKFVDALTTNGVTEVFHGLERRGLPDGQTCYNHYDCQSEQCIGVPHRICTNGWVGQYCNWNSECQSGRCAGVWGSPYYTCQNRFENGFSCSLNSDCLSNYCSWRWICE